MCVMVDDIFVIAHARNSTYLERGFVFFPVFVCAGHVFKSYKVAGHKHMCRSVTDLQRVLQPHRMQPRVQASAAAPILRESSAQVASWSAAGIVDAAGGGGLVLTHDTPPTLQPTNDAAQTMQLADCDAQRSLQQVVTNAYTHDANSGSLSDGASSDMMCDDAFGEQRLVASCKRSSACAAGDAMPSLHIDKRFKASSLDMCQSKHAVGGQVFEPLFSYVTEQDTRASQLPLRTARYLQKVLGLPHGARVDTSSVTSHRAEHAHVPPSCTRDVAMPTSRGVPCDELAPFLVGLPSDKLCAAGASFVYAGGSYPFSNVARCSPHLVAPVGDISSRVPDGDIDAHDVDNNGVEAHLHGGAQQECCAAQAACGIEDLASAAHAHDLARLVGENEWLRAQLNEVVQERDAAVILAQELHKQMADDSCVFGILALAYPISSA